MAVKVNSIGFTLINQVDGAFSPPILHAMKCFKVMFRPEPEGGYTAHVPSLPGCISFGETKDDARQMIKDAIRCYLRCMKEHCEDCCDDKDCLVEEITVEDD